MSFFIVTLLTAGAIQDRLDTLTYIGSYRLKYNLSHLLVQKKPTIWRAFKSI
jgi:hypothetical protein